MEGVNVANLIAVGVAIAVAAGIPALFPRLPLPGVVLEIAIGALIGPQLLGIAKPGPGLEFLAQFGLWMLFLMAGFEMDPAVLRGRPLRNALLGWATTLAIAFAAAFSLYGAGLGRAPVLTSLALSTTAVGALLPVLRDARLLGPPYGPMVLSAGAVGEAGPVIALSLVLADSRAPIEAAIILAFAVGATAVVVVTARARSHIAGVIDRTMGTSGQFPMRLAILLLFVMVVLSDQLDFDLVLGAFAAGAVVRAALSEHHFETFSARLDGIGSAFLVPIFFVVVGMKLDVAALGADPGVMLMVPVYALLMLAARGAPALLFYRSDLSNSQRIALALHSATQLPLVAAIASIGVKLGVMPGSQGAALVGAGILTVLLFPALARNVLKVEPRLGIVSEA